jgi:hypothetical protein
MTPEVAKMLEITTHVTYYNKHAFNVVFISCAG